jgi:AcrR family transcriptional regulator
MSISKTRLHLVDCARELFARKGLEATTMNDIAVASGKGRRTLYTYFKNKEEIYEAVITSELERLSERMDELANTKLPPEDKVLALVYTHLTMMKEAVARNGSLRAEFFRNIWTVERVRKQLDVEERSVIRRVLEEGIVSGSFEIENVNLMADIIYYSIKGLEVPYIYDRLGDGLSDEQSKAIVADLLKRVLVKR